MSVQAASSSPPQLTEKQEKILQYLHEHADESTYFKSRLIATELDMSAKEVGSNMRYLMDITDTLKIEKWGYSSGTTWKVTH
ncbi:MAG: hypothetical protein J07HQX50_00758 [Haloquadratum sp. J07HQX50]|jgi:hypothetical protein|nr:MAG: hypothetical protein J07HQX50_00758 [Haloquadratum sp. J07HQX50]